MEGEHQKNAKLYKRSVFTVAKPFLLINWTF